MSGRRTFRSDNACTLTHPKITSWSGGGEWTGDSHPTSSERNQTHVPGNFGMDNEETTTQATATVDPLTTRSLRSKKRLLVRRSRRRRRRLGQATKARFEKDDPHQRPHWAP